jgi:sec-independent protein translocase protein TatC
MPKSVHDKMPFLEHLGELRTRIMRALYGVLIGLVIGIPASKPVMLWLTGPVRALKSDVVFLSVAEAFWVQMKVALFVGLFVASPWVLWQVWLFIAPGLYPHERKYAIPFVLIGSLMFIAGGAFSLLVVTPNAVRFLVTFGTDAGLKPMISIASYVDFLLKFTLAFGAVFEVPLAITLLARIGVVTPQGLAKNRKYAILGAFIAGAVLTPTPDMVNQTLMAGPIVILYEVGIICARIFGKRRAAAPTVAEAQPPA